MIATMTFHNADNYGAVLQALALQKFIKSLNYETELIDFTPQKKVSILVDRYSKKSKYIDYILHPLYKIQMRKKHQRFTQFRKEHLSLSIQSYKSDDELFISKINYSHIIVGSDQVWNPLFIKDSSAYFLDFTNTSKKISYAASLGNDVIQDEFLLSHINSMQKFQAISLREKNHSDYLNQKFALNTVVALDPVFLLNIKEWENFSRPFKLPKKYLLVYLLEEKIYYDKMAKLAKKIAIEKKLKIVYISSKRLKSTDKVHISIGPSQFLYALKNAEYICTNSFHGISFSIIFNKDFTAYRHLTRNSRIENILSIAGLKDRYHDSEKLNLSQINYSVINQKIKHSIDDSKSFILENLKD